MQYRAVTQNIDRVIREREAKYLREIQAKVCYVVCLVRDGISMRNVK